MWENKQGGFLKLLFTSELALIKIGCEFVNLKVQTMNFFLIHTFLFPWLKS